MRIQIKWVILTVLQQKICDFIVAQWWLDDADHRHGFQPQLTHRIRGSIQLTLSAIDDDKVRKRFSFVKHPTITSGYDFSHRRDVVRSFNVANSKLSVFGP